MLLNKRGEVVQVETNKANRVQKLFALREKHEVTNHKCGKMFQIGTRARMKA